MFISMQALSAMPLIDSLIIGVVRKRPSGPNVTATCRLRTESRLAFDKARVFLTRPAWE